MGCLGFRSQPRKVLKRTTREELLAVLAEAWGSIPKQKLGRPFKRHFWIFP